MRMTKQMQSGEWICIGDRVEAMAKLAAYENAEEQREINLTEETVGKKRKSMYTDAQWKWLHDRLKEGYYRTELFAFARCSKGNLDYHWERLGLAVDRGMLPPLNRAEFEALGEGR